MKNFLIIVFSLLFAVSCKYEAKETAKQPFTITQNVSKEYIQHVDSIKLQNNVPDEAYSSLESVQLERAMEAQRTSDNIEKWAEVNNRVASKTKQLEVIEKAMDSSIARYSAKIFQVKVLEDNLDERIKTAKRGKSQLDKLYATNDEQ